MRLEAATVWLVGLVGTTLGQVRWGGQGQAGQGGGFNPGDEFPALGQPSSNPGVACRNETTGVFGPCTGPDRGPKLSTGFQAGVSSAFTTGANSTGRGHSGGQGYNPGSTGGQGYNPGSSGGQGYNPGSSGGQGYNPGSTGGQGYNPGSSGGQGYNPGFSGGHGYNPGSSGGQGYNPGTSGGQGYNPGGRGGQGYNPGSSGGQGYNPGGRGGQGGSHGGSGGSGYKPGWSWGGGPGSSAQDCDTLEQRITELEQEKTRLEAQRRSCPSSSSSANSCRGKCGSRYNRTLACQCNNGCTRFSNCCTDYSTVCSSSSSSALSQRSPLVWASGRTTDNELARLSEELLDRDVDNAANKVELDLGCTTRTGNPRDCSPRPLFKRMDQSLLRRPVYSKLLALYNNYDVDTTVKETVTRSELNEEEDFLNEVMKSDVMKETMRFLSVKQLFTKSATEFKKLLKEFWFTLYSRGNRILGSSGFEHVFLGEKKLGKVQGFHNWVYFYQLEKRGQVNYLGHWESPKLGNHGTGLSFTFKWGAEQKPFASMAVGPSPTLELALYTTCLLARGEQPCRLRLGGHQVTITTHVFSRPGGKRHVASTYMDW